MMIVGSGIEAEMVLCGRTRPPLMYTSSSTCTSWPKTDTFSKRAWNAAAAADTAYNVSYKDGEESEARRRDALKRTHRPIVDCQPTIDCLTKAFSFTTTPSRIVEFTSRAPVRCAPNESSASPDESGSIERTTSNLAVLADHYIGANQTALADGCRRILPQPQTQKATH